MTGNRSAPRPPPIPAKKPLTAIQAWYLECWRRLRKHLKRPPTILEVARYCGRTHTPVYVALIQIEDKGHLRRLENGRFEEVVA